ncbi:hypothetical protein V6N13_128188 [Hibiscus sabdariffa]
MEKLVSSWYKNKTLPQSYIFPPETRPGNLIVPTCKTILVIDLGSTVDQSRTRIVQQILKASQEYGFFQVINHGITEDLMDQSMDVFKEFFNMPAEDKAMLYSLDPESSCRLLTSSVNYAREKIISNNKLKSVEHRVVTNSNCARTSVGFFIAPSDDSIIEPAKSVVGNAAVYRAFEFKEFLLHFFPNFHNNDLVMERFKLQA